MVQASVIDPGYHPLGKPPENLPALLPAPAARVLDRGHVRISDVDLSRANDRKRFLGMVSPIYAGDPNFIMPLWMDRMKFLDTARNPSLRGFEIKAMLAERGGQIVGRITAHIDHEYNRYHGTDSAGWFGFFESIDDRAVAHALLTEATGWLASRGVKEIIGPMNFSTNHQCGLLVENFSRPAVIEMTYNPNYYEDLITSFGFGKAKDLLAWWLDVGDWQSNPRISRVAKLAERVRVRTGVTLRHASKKNFDREVETLFTIYNEAWQRNWGFVPVGKDEFRAIARDLKPILKEELILFVEVGGKPVGFSVTLPDVNEAVPRDGRLLPWGWLKLLVGLRKIRHSRLMALGIAPEYRKRGLETLLFIETARRSAALGMSAGEIGWTLEDNDLVNAAIGHMDGKLDRRYRLFGLTV